MLIPIKQDKTSLRKEVLKENDVFLFLFSFSFFASPPFPPPCNAAANGHHEVVSVLLELGADASLTDSRGETALDIARLFELEEVVAVLEPTKPSEDAVESTAQEATPIPPS